MNRVNMDLRNRQDFTFQIRAFLILAAIALAAGILLCFYNASETAKAQAAAELAAAERVAAETAAERAAAEEAARLEKELRLRRAKDNAEASREQYYRVVFDVRAEGGDTQAESGASVVLTGAESFAGCDLFWAGADGMIASGTGAVSGGTASADASNTTGGASEARPAASSDSDASGAKTPDPAADASGAKPANPSTANTSGANSPDPSTDASGANSPNPSTDASGANSPNPSGSASGAGAAPQNPPQQVSVLVPKGQSLRALPEAVKTGYRFLGWFSGPADDKDAVLVKDARISGIPADTDSVLYARFEKAPADVPKGHGLPVLMYHYFYDPDLGESGLDANWMSIHSFEEQVRFLTENGYYFPDWEEVAGHVAGSVALPDKSVVIISDDGHESFFRLAIPVIERYGARATGAVIAKDYTREQLDAWRSDHIFFQSHSYDMHRGGTSGIGHNGRLLSATEEEIREDLALSEERIGTKAVYVYPFGDSTEFVRGVLRENGVRLAFTTQNGRCYPGQDPLLLPRVRMAGGQTIEGFAWLVR